MSGGLEVRGVYKRYSKAKQALRGADLPIQPGSITGLLGPNAAGKTTLLKVIAGLLIPDEGHIAFDGKPQSPLELKAAVSFLPDSLPLPAWMKVSDAVGYWAHSFPDFDIARCRSLLEAAGLDYSHAVKGLSKGMAERLSLALTFGRNAKAYVLDEPLGGLDPAEKQRIVSSMLTLDLGDAAMLISTHLLRDVEGLIDEVAIIAGGSIVLSGNADGLREEKAGSLEEIYMEAVEGRE